MRIIVEGLGEKTIVPQTKYTLRGVGGVGLLDDISMSDGSQKFGRWNMMRQQLLVVSLQVDGIYFQGDNAVSGEGMRFDQRRVAPTAAVQRRLLNMLDLVVIKLQMERAGSLETFQESLQRQMMLGDRVAGGEGD
jgi:hypothetical protein